jgi:hypothetical protein
MLPSQAALKSLVGDYTKDAGTTAAANLSRAESSATFRQIYHCSLSADAVLRELSTAELRPAMNGPRSIVLRVPLLVAIGQPAVARTEIRRYLELIFWLIYFSNHPIEWLEFKGSIGAGFSRDARKPISYAAHRELQGYFEYATELMEGDPSKIALTALADLKGLIHTLNAAIHPGELARRNVKFAPFDEIDEKSLENFLSLQRGVFSNTCLLVAAYKQARFEKLTAVTRSHFEWLIGPKVAKKLRSCQFGLRL